MRGANRDPTEDSAGYPENEVWGFPYWQQKPRACCQMGSGASETPACHHDFLLLWTHCLAGQRPTAGPGSSLLSGCLLPTCLARCLGLEGAGAGEEPMIRSQHCLLPSLHNHCLQTDKDLHTQSPSLLHRYTETH